MDQLERKIAAPTASADQIVSALQGVTTPSTEDSRNLVDGSPLRKMLDQVEQSSGGSRSINLHGRLLAQWLRHAFPHDCPYPIKGGSVKPLTATQYQEQAVKNGGETIDYSKAPKSNVKQAAAAADVDDDDDDDII